METYEGAGAGGRGGQKSEITTWERKKATKKWGTREKGRGPAQTTTPREGNGISSGNVSLRGGSRRVNHGL